MGFKLNKDKEKRVHFVGIGGVSMSGLAAILINKGYKISGSDRGENKSTEKLKAMGADIFAGHKSENISDCDIVVYTAAISQDNVELVCAREKNIPCFERAEFLGFIMRDYKKGIAVAGTHGKTTSTAMITHVTMKGNLDPTILVGGELDLIDGNYRIGNSDCFVTESCEYKASFLKFHPKIGIILNIEEDHLDYYRDIHHIEDAFRKFSALIPKDGYLIGCVEDEIVAGIISDAQCNKLTYGLNRGDLTAEHIVFDNRGCAEFIVSFKDYMPTFKVKLNVPGKHNILNALCSIAVGLVCDIDPDNIKEGIESFCGIHKRFEYKGERDGVTVIDDYAHHPTEVKATLETARNTEHNKIYCVFQPHTYTRTHALFNDFVTAFDDADELILLDIYAAREADTGEVSSKELAAAINKRNNKCLYVGSHEDAVSYLKKRASKGDVILTVGAGDVVTVGELFLN